MQYGIDSSEKNTKQELRDSEAAGEDTNYTTRYSIRSGPEPRLSDHASAAYAMTDSVKLPIVSSTIALASDPGRGTFSSKQGFRSIRVDTFAFADCGKSVKIKPITVKEIDRKRFKALTGESRSPAASYVSEELAWYANEDETIIAVLLNDTVDNDFAAIIMARDEGDRFVLSMSRRRLQPKTLRVHG